MSSRAWIIDLLHAIGEKTALADHLEEKLISEEDDKRRSEIQLTLDKVIQLRREQMSYLLEQAEKADPTFHCDVKHAIKAFTLDSEVYEATQSEKAFRYLQVSADVLAMVCGMYLGLDEFQTCARCFADLALIKQYEDGKEHSDEKQD